MDFNQIMDANIIRAVRILSSDKRFGHPILPFHVWSFGDEFGIYAVEGTIRRRMKRLAKDGRLIRVGGNKKNTRRGYTIADWRRIAKQIPPESQPPQFVRYNIMLDVS